MVNFEETSYTVSEAVGTLQICLEHYSGEIGAGLAPGVEVEFDIIDLSDDSLRKQLHIEYMYNCI